MSNVIQFPVRLKELSGKEIIEGITKDISLTNYDVRVDTPCSQYLTSRRAEAQREYNLLVSKMAEMAALKPKFWSY